MEQEEDTKIGFFEEAPGSSSLIRLLSFFSLWMSFFFGVITLCVGKIRESPNNDIGVWFTLFFFIGAFAPKVIQKMIEVAMPIFIERAMKTKLPK